MGSPLESEAGCGKVRALKKSILLLISRDRRLWSSGSASINEEEQKEEES